MAKEKKDDYKFDKLSGLNLATQPNIDDIKEEPKAKKETKPVDEIEEEERPKKKKKTKKEEPATIKTSFKIEKELHLALKQYCLLEGEDMATVVFEQVIKSFLKRKGYYPVSKK